MSRKSKWLTILLALVFSPLGFHLMYLRRGLSAAIFLAISVPTAGIGGLIISFLDLCTLLAMSKKDFDGRYNFDRRPQDGSFVFNDSITAADLASLDVVEAALKHAKTGNWSMAQVLISPLMVVGKMRTVPHFRAFHIDSLLMCGADIEAKKSMMEYLVDKKEDETLPLFHAREAGQKLMHECWKILNAAKNKVEKTANVCSSRGEELDEITAAIKEKTDRDIEDIMGRVT